MYSRLLIPLMSFGCLLLDVCGADDPAVEPLAAMAIGKEDTLAYRYFVPAKDIPRPVPVVLFLHGAGERGDDNRSQLKHGVRDFVDPSSQASFPCIVIAPQCSREEWWSGNTLKLAIAAMEHIAKVNGGDPARYYITGLSMGGFGSWSALAMRSELFAAALPICGGGDPATVKKFTTVPVRAYHGADDKVVLPEKSRVMVEALKAAGGQAEYIEIPGVGHACWGPVYHDPAVRAWLFARNRPRPASP